MNKNEGILNSSEFNAFLFFLFLAEERERFYCLRIFRALFLWTAASNFDEQGLKLHV